MKLTWSHVTPKAIYMDRRKFMAAGAVALAAPALMGRPALALSGKPSQYSTDQAPNTLEEITSYNSLVTGKPAIASPMVPFVQTEDRENHQVIFTLHGPGTLHLYAIATN